MKYKNQKKRKEKREKERYMYMYKNLGAVGVERLVVIERGWWQRWWGSCNSTNSTRGCCGCCSGRQWGQCQLQDRS